MNNCVAKFKNAIYLHVTSKVTMCKFIILVGVYIFYKYLYLQFKTIKVDSSELREIRIRFQKVVSLLIACFVSFNWKRKGPDADLYQYCIYCFLRIRFNKESCNLEDFESTGTNLN